MKICIMISLMVFSSHLYGGVSIGNGLESFTVGSDSLGASIYGQVKKLLRKLKKALKKEQLFRQGEFKRLVGLIKSNDIELAQRVLDDYELKGGRKVDKAVRGLRQRIDSLIPEDNVVEQEFRRPEENCPGSGLDEVVFFSTSRAFAALKPSGLVIAWGDADYGGDSGEIADEISCGVVDVVANKSAFVALKADGSVVTWGDSDAGGDSSAVSSELNNVSKIYATDRAFVAVKKDGSIVPWGDPHYGGEAAIFVGDSRQVVSRKAFSLHSSLLDGTRGRVVKIVSTGAAFAAMLEDRQDTTRKFVVAWGNGWLGGDLVSHGPHPNIGTLSLYVAPLLENGVADIFANDVAFAALKDDGSVVAWGYDEYHGGSWSSVVSNLQSGVIKIFPSYDTFIALKNDGSVVVWGYDGSLTIEEDREKLSNGVLDVVTSGYGLAAVKDDGSVVVWGRGAGEDQYVPAPDLPQNFVKLVGSFSGFAAIKSDGGVISWGFYEIDDKWGREYFLHPVQDIFSNDHAFAALMDNGAVFAWGWDEAGGYSHTNYINFLDAHQRIYDELHDDFRESHGRSAYAIEELKKLELEATKRSIHHLYMVQSGAVKIASTDAAFVALKDDGTIVTWGAVGYGADSSSVASLFGQ